MASRQARGWRRSGCYVWRTRKPTSFLGIGLRWLLPAAVVLAGALALAGWHWWPALLLPLFSGRHTAYVGETGSRYFRDRQHLYGDTRYGAAGKPWADLDPKVYPLPCLLPQWRRGRRMQEWLYIKLLLPVYNEQHNRHNPRRIRPVKAEQLRWARQARGMKVNIGRVLMRYALAITLLAGATWSMWERM